MRHPPLMRRRALSLILILSLVAACKMPPNQQWAPYGATITIHTDAGARSIDMGVVK